MLLTSLPLLNNDTNFHSPMSGPILLPLYTLQTSVQEIWRHKSFNQWFGYGINYHPSPLLGLAIQHPNKSKRPFGPRARSKFPILPRLSTSFQHPPSENFSLARGPPTIVYIYPTWDNAISMKQYMFIMMSGQHYFIKLYHYVFPFL